jgi:hypothetical protein
MHQFRTTQMKNFNPANRETKAELRDLAAMPVASFRQRQDLSRVPDGPLTGEPASASARCPQPERDAKGLSRAVFAQHLTCRGMSATGRVVSRFDVTRPGFHGMMKASDSRLEAASTVADDSLRAGCPRLPAKDAAPQRVEANMVPSSPASDTKVAPHQELAEVRSGNDEAFAIHPAVRRHLRHPQTTPTPPNPAGLVLWALCSPASKVFGTAIAAISNRELGVAVALRHPCCLPATDPARALEARERPRAEGMSRSARREVPAHELRGPRAFRKPIRVGDPTATAKRVGQRRTGLATECIRSGNVARNGHLSRLSPSHDEIRLLSFTEQRGAFPNERCSHSHTSLSFGEGGPCPCP